MPAMTHPLCLLHRKPTKLMHFYKQFCPRTPLTWAPLNAMTLELIIMRILRITANLTLRLQKHLNVILSRLVYQNTSVKIRLPKHSLPKHDVLDNVTPEENMCVVCVRTTGKWRSLGVVLQKVFLLSLTPQDRDLCLLQDSAKRGGIQQL